MAREKSQVRARTEKGVTCSRPLEGREHVTLRSAIPTRYAPLNAFKLGFCAKSVRKTPRVSGGPELLQKGLRDQEKSRKKTERKAAARTRKMHPCRSLVYSDHKRSDHKRSDHKDQVIRDQTIRDQIIRDSII